LNLSIGKQHRAMLRSFLPVEVVDFAHSKVQDLVERKARALRSWLCLDGETLRAWARRKTATHKEGFHTLMPVRPVQTRLETIEIHQPIRISQPRRTPS
jgi:hypothetical protein